MKTAAFAALLAITSMGAIAYAQPAPAPGPAKAKKGWRDGLVVLTPEYEDCARIARDRGIPLREVFEAIRGREQSR